MKNGASHNFLKNHENLDNLLKGFLAGMAATWAVEFSRNHVLPNIDSWKLYDTYGICRDRLEGRVGIAAATLGLAAVQESQPSDFKKSCIQMAGVLMGTCAANYISKIAS